MYFNIVFVLLQINSHGYFLRDPSEEMKNQMVLHIYHIKIWAVVVKFVMMIYYFQLLFGFHEYFVGNCENSIWILW